MMRGGNPLDSILKMNFLIFFAAPTPKKILDLRLKFVDSMKKIMKGGLTVNGAAGKFAPWDEFAILACNIFYFNQFNRSRKMETG